MKRSRIGWLICVILGAVYYLFVNGRESLLVLLLVIIAPIISGVLFGFSKDKLSAELDIIRAVNKYEIVNGSIDIKNMGLFPVEYIVMEYYIKNIRTGKEHKETVRFAVQSKGIRTQSIQVDTSNCGDVCLGLNSVTAYDVFGIFKRELELPEPGKCSVMPKQLEGQVRINESRMQELDSDEYSLTTPGNDPSETFGIREYVPGDSIKQIHWKLSGKTEQVMIREMSLPIVRNILLLVETRQSPMSDADLLDGALEGGLAVARGMVKAGMNVTVGFDDETAEGYIEQEINSEDELYYLTKRLLSIPSDKQSGSISMNYVRKHPHCPFSHVAIFSNMPQEHLVDIYNGNEVTCVEIVRSSSSSRQADGVNLVKINYENLAEEINGIAI